MNGKRSRIVIAGTGSGVGKTTVAIGLMAALRRRGLQVQGFKCGPDYIDPTYHTAVTGRESRNIDTWMLPTETNREIFLRASHDADISVIEGVMGLYDGKEALSNTGSTAEIASLLASPVILVVNAQSLARSAAAVVLGYQKLDESIRIAGVIVNKCGSERHYAIVKAAIEQECGIPVVGWLKRESAPGIPERHLGLIPAIERGELADLFSETADKVEAGIDLHAILTIAEEVPELEWPKQRLFGDPAAAGSHPVIAVANDAAFNFYYRENLELLEQYGARLIVFSPLAGDHLPEEADGLYLGGGFPEEYAAGLAANELLKRTLHKRVQEGMPLFAECGGYMYLARSITDRAGTLHVMAGLVPVDIAMQDRPAALGYREAKATRDCLLLNAGEIIRGHEFHYSRLVPSVEEVTESYPYAFETTGSRGTGLEGYRSGNLLAGYTHVHFASNPAAAERFVRRCLEYSRKRGLADGTD
ncbi:cobyrinate a,c-diamide synthase [Paenibacillus sp. HN-1]|uniref:cobyrinate a,c-diamide synthase n=1 Tax=Paenibacillus TaxID=44249 RepID=UPI001CA9FCCE|nr:MULTISPECIES: cobyrinate a,c-diamide synthase [Paenibacillus]MBY9078148.1 cobyrinate a,c-diamide synthase [Paenibacillus sp. CGMCC 1.18879]MBY9083889.1 cobyrinate a,c-diamide synthase [Paenibacillus sinensis]